MRTPASQRPRPPRTRQPPESGDLPPRRSRGRHALSTRKPATRAGSALRNLTGALAAGSVLLSIALVVIQFWATNQGQEGPGLPAVIAQLVAAVVALALQATADRHRDVPGGFATCGVLVIVVGSLWFWWWL
ncbi:hypothetical protein MOQ72_09955 [Saccharopolyspora sp. K220]|uniref:hypothetical protein n=1 Tax=Saccharopolyspora soli TaxID=2926618 RepID=UPI001F5AEC7A|nr:hypothetical protein [Saccharopolyspora soli]MCI2417749.1 hypothetical protein [Saccharopolyspora soli]